MVGLLINIYLCFRVDIRLKQTIKSMRRYRAIQFTRHIAQFHIQFYGTTTSASIYFMGLLNPLETSCVRARLSTLLYCLAFFSLFNPSTIFFFYSYHGLHRTSDDTIYIYRLSLSVKKKKTK